MSGIVETGLDFPEERAILHETWSGHHNPIVNFITTTDHKQLGLRYIITALCFFALGGVEAALMRIQLSRPENSFLNPDLYNQIFTMHGSTMMFLFAVPIMQGFAIYLFPLMIGTRDVPFPKLNNFGYWVYLFGGVFLYVMFFVKAGESRTATLISLNAGQRSVCPHLNKKLVKGESQCQIV